MKGAMIGKCLIGMLVLISTPQWIMAKAVYPAKQITSETAIISLLKDTVPTLKKITNAPGDKPVPNDKPVAKVIKVVPKARRQTVPVPVNVKIKPVKIKPNIIKPKIVRPVIRGLH
ncbi:MAG TPA: hypothetical protein VGW31_02830 [Hanamia sp.]|jgi:hypothetical protein|nr:hypothetical protein [Hanamia sp.]